MTDAREAHRDVFEVIDEAANDTTDVGERLAVVLAAMRRHQDLTPQRMGRRGLGFREGVVQSVDRRVARDPDVICSNALAQQVGPRPSCRREVKIGDARGQAAVDLLGKRLPAIEGTQPRLHVGNGNSVVEGSKRPAKRGRRVPLHDHAGGTLRFDRLIQPLQSSGRHLREGLIVAHDVEIDGHRKIEVLDHLIEHFSVLARTDDTNVEARVLGGRDRHRSQLDGLWTGPDDDHESVGQGRASGLRSRQRSRGRGALTSAESRIMCRFAGENRRLSYDCVSWCG